jgi:hypothetical protein
VPADLDPVQRADIDVLGVGWARVHADIATDDHAGLGLANHAQRVTFGRVLAQAITDCRRTSAKRQKPAGRGEVVAVGHRVRDLLG